MSDTPQRGMSDTYHISQSASDARAVARDARSAEFNIDAVLADNSAAMSEMGIITSPEQQRRDRNQQALERVFPGLTEDEQTVSGMYEPSIKNYPKGAAIRYPSMASWESEGDLFSHRARTEIGQGEETGIPGRIYPPHQIIDLNPELNTPDRDSRVYPFEEGLIRPTDFIVGEGAYRRDRENAINWAKQHRQEVARTGNTDTEGKRRLGQLLSDVATYNPPLANLGYYPALEEVHTEANNRHLDFVRELYNKLDDSDVNLDLSGQVGRVVGRVEQTSTSRPSNSRNNRRNRGQVTNSRQAANRMVAGLPARAGRRTGTGHTFRGEDTNPEDTLYGGWLNPATYSNEERTGTDFAVHSYGTPIAWRQAESQNWVMPTQRHSNTTSKHQSAIRSALYNTNHVSPQVAAEHELSDLYNRQGTRRRLPKRLFEPNYSTHTFTTDYDTADTEQRRLVREHLDNVVIPEIQRRDAKFRTPSRMRRAGQMELPFGDGNA